ncbi:MAG: amino acid ABC transporter substrate-binding protein [Eubacteriales bacterium]|nr:amino acid ABC transporter substrate-binding protein [Eubacteriales bacterium]MDD4461801.1 amino acid ABC transporter substrate-binding protein [Eubacteriales bacterium]
MRKFYRLILAGLLMAALVLTGCGASEGKDDSLKAVRDKGELVMGLDDAFPPMGFRDDENELVGFDIDVAKEVASRMEIELRLQPIDWTQNVSELASGQIDCIWNGYTITDERAEQVNFSEPYMRNRQVIVVRSESDVETLDDLAGLKLVLQAGSSAVSALEKAEELKDSLAEVVELKDNVTAFLDLQSGATDALLIDEIVANYYITTNSADFRVLDESLAEEEFGIGFRKNDQALRDEVQKTLEAMQADGTLAEISDKWFNVDLTTIKAP